jgi:hypothetical protein
MTLEVGGYYLCMDEYIREYWLPWAITSRGRLINCRIFDKHGKFLGYEGLVQGEFEKMVTERVRRKK